MPGGAGGAEAASGPSMQLATQSPFPFNLPLPQMPGAILPYLPQPANQVLPLPPSSSAAASAAALPQLPPPPLPPPLSAPTTPSPLPSHLLDALFPSTINQHTPVESLDVAHLFATLRTMPGEDLLAAELRSPRPPRKGKPVQGCVRLGHAAVAPCRWATGRIA